MQNTNTEITVFDNAQKPFYCSVKANTVEEKKKLFNALENCDNLLNDCVGQKIKIKDIYIEQYLAKVDDDDEGKIKYRTILFAEDGKTFVSTSYGIYNVLKKICSIYGYPETWTEPIEVEVAKRPMGNGKSLLTLKLV